MQGQIDTLVGDFFSAFDNRKGRIVDLSSIRPLFVPSATIVKSAGKATEVMSVAEFIQPRQVLLTDGSLCDFHEREVEARTFIFGEIACRTLRYTKEGIFDGAPFTGEGMKSMHLVQLDGDWRITSIVWQDEDATLAIESASWSNIEDVVLG